MRPWRGCCSGLHSAGTCRGVLSGGGGAETSQNATRSRADHFLYNVGGGGGRGGGGGGGERGSSSGESSAPPTNCADNIWGGNFRCVCVCVCFVYTDKYGGVYGLGGQEYAYHHNEDESSFQLVDTTKTVRRM